MNVDIKQNLFVLDQLVQRDRKRNYSSTKLGQLWEILNPLILMLVMATLFSTMFGNNSFVNYPIYAMIGNLFYTFFSCSTSNCLTALTANKSFLIKSNVKKNIYIYQRVQMAVINFLWSLLIFIIVCFGMSFIPKVTSFLVIFDFVFCLLLVIGIGKLLAIINVIFADITYFHKIFVVMMMYGSAIFYSAERMSPSVQKFLSFNPLYLIITIARKLIIDGEIPKWTVWVKVIVYSIGIYYVGTKVYDKYSEDIVSKM